MSEHREYEVRPNGANKTSMRAVKLPGEQRHTERSVSAKDIARRLAVEKRERAMKERIGG